MSNPSQLQAITLEKTLIAGNWNAGSSSAEIKTTPPHPVKSLRVTWNGAVVKGFSVEFYNTTDIFHFGDWANRDLNTATLQLQRDDVLKEAQVWIAPYGHESVFGMRLVTRDYPGGWLAGNVNSAATFLSVRDRTFFGISASLNKDYFMNAMGLYINAV